MDCGMFATAVTVEEARLRDVWLRSRYGHRTPYPDIYKDIPVVPGPRRIELHFFQLPPSESRTASHAEVDEIMAGKGLVPDFLSLVKHHNISPRFSEVFGNAISLNINGLRYTATFHEWVLRIERADHFPDRSVWFSGVPAYLLSDQKAMTEQPVLLAPARL